ncbi:MAG: phosphodiester glycosidase family protein, partial [Clostridiales bacterium]|nr:phosphodiester glycosidase family protein [Clostridiales bacterium]
NHYIIIVADGRQEMSKGLTLEELAKLFEYYECETAYNLDGGASSIMILENEIISSPSGGTERKSTDIIFFQ